MGIGLVFPPGTRIAVVFSGGGAGFLSQLTLNWNWIYYICYQGSPRQREVPLWSPSPQLTSQFNVHSWIVLSSQLVIWVFLLSLEKSIALEGPKKVSEECAWETQPSGLAAAGAWLHGF